MLSNQIENYRQSHESEGFVSYQATMQAISLLYHRMKHDPNWELTTDEAIDLMHSVVLLGRFASEQWATAIALDVLLQELAA